MLPHTVRQMVPRAPHEIGRLARTLGAGSAEAAPDAIARLTERSGVTTLRELGVRDDQLDEIAETAAGLPTVKNTPRPPEAPELRSVLARALG
jgi:alcohol dehydrogenase class IV